MSLCGNGLTLIKRQNFGHDHLKAFAGNKTISTQKLKFVLKTVENIVEEGEDADYQHFLLFPQCFQKASHTGSLKVVIVW